LFTYSSHVVLELWVLCHLQSTKKISTRISTGIDASTDADIKLVEILKVFIKDENQKQGQEDRGITKENRNIEKDKLLLLSLLLFKIAIDSLLIEEDRIVKEKMTEKEEDRIVKENQITEEGRWSKLAFFFDCY
jgi:hypothetical protein